MATANCVIKRLVSGHGGCRPSKLRLNPDFSVCKILTLVTRQKHLSTVSCQKYFSRLPLTTDWFDVRYGLTNHRHAHYFVCHGLFGSPQKRRASADRVVLGNDRHVWVGDSGRRVFIPRVFVSDG